MRKTVCSPLASTAAPSAVTATPDKPAPGSTSKAVTEDILDAVAEEMAATG